MEETYIANQATEPEGSNNVLFSPQEHVLYYRGEGMFKSGLHLKISIFRAHLKHLVFSTISACDKHTLYGSSAKQKPLDFFLVVPRQHFNHQNICDKAQRGHLLWRLHRQ